MALNSTGSQPVQKEQVAKKVADTTSGYGMSIAAPMRKKKATPPMKGKY